MSLLRKNIIANYIGRGWAAFMPLMFVPYYISVLGVEAYGLIGFFVALQGIISLFDLGLSTALNRELALNSDNDNSGGRRDIVRTIEVVYWSVAFLIGLLGVVFSGYVSESWIKSVTIPDDQVSGATMYMFLCIAMQWPFAMYSGGLMGLQKQVRLNVLQVLFSTLKWAGAGLVLALVYDPDIVIFFKWLFFSAAVQSVFTGVMLWHCLEGDFLHAVFSVKIVRRIWRFSAGVAGIGITGVILSQMDKILLSKLLSLEYFGYYAIAALLVSVVYMIIGPIYAAAFPRFSELSSKVEAGILKREYHKLCQVASIAIIPVVATGYVYSREILSIWTQDEVIAGQTHKIFEFLLLGGMLNALYFLPYGMQLAYGWTRLALMINTISILVLVPVLYLGVKMFGAEGAAFVWVILNAGYIFIALPIMHTKVLVGELSVWYFQDFGIPVAVSFLMAYLLYEMLPSVSVDNLVSILLIPVAYIVVLLFASMTVPVSRDLVRGIRVFSR